MDAYDDANSAFAVVHDIAASWEHYWPLRSALDPTSTPDLILHAAGTTDEGFRTIDIWHSEAAWRQFNGRHGVVVAHLPLAPIVRVLSVRALVPARPAHHNEGGRS